MKTRTTEPTTATGARKTNSVYSEWDVETILDGYNREIVQGVIGIIPDSFTLVEVLGELRDIRSSCIVRDCFADEMYRRIPDCNDVGSENNPKIAEWDDFSDAEISDAVDMLLTQEEKRRRAACIALCAAYGITPDTIRLTLAKRNPA